MTDSTRTAPAEPTQQEPGAPLASSATGDALAAIQTWTEPVPAAGVVALSRRTAEPTRVWTVWLAAFTCYLATAVIGAATLVVYWNAAVTGSLTLDEASGDWRYEYDDSRFAQASWLMGQFDTEPGSLGRVLLAVAVTVIALLIGAAAAITGYYAYDGRRWTRWSALATLALSSLSLMLNPLAWPVIGLAAIAAIALWLPPSGRYFAAWRAVRHREPVFSEPPDQVWYGPLPKYR
ncbi:MAG: hypothetical protein AAGC63_00145 [Propionicimonas sp.]|nr:hypothetical protein [Propionicimonas sp.]